MYSRLCDLFVLGDPCVLPKSIQAKMLVLLSRLLHNGKRGSELEKESVPFVCLSALLVSGIIEPEVVEP